MPTPRVHASLRFTSNARGRAVIAANDIPAHSHLIVERPLLSMGLPESNDQLLSCVRCCRPRGTVTGQIKHLTGLKKLPELPLDEEDNILAGNVPGDGGVFYCSEACKEQHSQAHAFLCGHSASAAAALSKFEDHALSTHEYFLFGARLIADVLARRKDSLSTSTSNPEGPYAALCRAPWWEISDEGVPKSAKAQQQVKREAATSLNLLKKLLKITSPKTDLEWLTLDAWGGLLGASRRNAICVQLPHPLQEFVPALQEWASNQPPSKHAEKVDELLEALPSPLPEPLWTAGYEKISQCNHDCKPNAEVHFFNEDHEATLLALRKIEKGEEIFITYIDDNERSDYKKRRASLRDYGFECDCEKCVNEEQWARRLRPRRS